MVASGCSRLVRFSMAECERSIPERFERQAAQYPDRLAVKGSQHELTYEALNQLANRFARAILAQQSGEGTPIALLLEPGPQMVAAILGTLKAGRIWVALDASYGQSKLQYMLDDSEATVIVTDATMFSAAERLARDRCQVIHGDTALESFSGENLGLRISPDTLAYLIYSSGSTGEPRGVVHSHRSALHYTMGYTNSLGIGPEDRVSLLGSSAHNAGVSDVFRAILNGAALLSFDVRNRPLGELTGWLTAEKVTIYHSMPSLFRQWVATFSGREGFPDLRVIHLGGEPLSVSDVEEYRRHFAPACVLLNNLGCTEASAFRQYFVRKETKLSSDIVPAGYAVADKEVLILSEEGTAVGIDRVGEIAIKSRYLAAGYWRRPELTRTSFPAVPDGGGERIYRTGDLGRMSHDGCLFHLGRKDSRVKLRGYWVELAEIERRLLEQPTIKQAVVVEREERPGERSLVAYVVPASRPGPSVNELRQALAERMAGYMIPSRFVIRDALPLTGSGKVDRRALPVPGRGRPELEATFVGPRTPIEEELARIWAEVLQLDQVGIHDDFLELGGHSLLATQVASRVLDTFAVPLPPRTLLEANTVACMAVAVTVSLAGNYPTAEVEEMLTAREGRLGAEGQHRYCGPDPQGYSRARSQSEES
jgi:amino acid adenylation domain-containing protein